MTRRPRWTHRQVNELKSLYETGAPFRTIAETLDRSTSAIRTRAQICGFRRPRRLGPTEIDALRMLAVNRGLDGSILPMAPTALRILICLAENDIATKPVLDKACAVSPSGRNKAIQSLKSQGLVVVDDFCSPNELILARKAYLSRPEPMLVDYDQISIGKLPSMTTLCSELDSWLMAICRNQASMDAYKAFIVRQLQNAESGDVVPADFYSIFYRSKRK